MTDETRTELRHRLEALIRCADSEQAVIVDGGQLVSSVDGTHEGTFTQHDVSVRHGGSYRRYPELTTAQQLALSVLLGEDVPLGVLLNACEDDGTFPNGVLEAVAEKARAEERERCATLIETARYTISPGVIGQVQIVALAQKIAAGLRSQ